MTSGSVDGGEWDLLLASEELQRISHIYGTGSIDLVTGTAKDLTGFTAANVSDLTLSGNFGSSIKLPVTTSLVGIPDLSLSDVTLPPSLHWLCRAW